MSKVNKEFGKHVSNKSELMKLLKDINDSANDAKHKPDKQADVVPNLEQKGLQSVRRSHSRQRESTPEGAAADGDEGADLKKRLIEMMGRRGRVSLQKPRLYEEHPPWRTFVRNNGGIHGVCKKLGGMHVEGNEAFVLDSGMSMPDGSVTPPTDRHRGPATGNTTADEDGASLKTRLFAMMQQGNGSVSMQCLQVLYKEHHPWKTFVRSNGGVHGLCEVFGGMRVDNNLRFVLDSSVPRRLQG